MDGKREKMVLLVLLAGAALAAAQPMRAALDVAVTARGSHALLTLGFATVSIAFESGHDCPNSNGCAGAIL